MDTNIKRNLHYLVEYTVNHGALIEKLKAKGILIPEDAEEIENIFDTRHQVLKMYIKLARKGPTKKGEIFEALNETKNKHIVAKLLRGSLRVGKAAIFATASTDSAQSETSIKNVTLTDSHVEKLTGLIRRDKETFKRWEDICRELLNRKDFCKIQKESFLLSIEELVSKTLHLWIAERDGHATIKELIKVLINCGLRHIAGKIQSEICT